MSNQMGQPNQIILVADEAGNHTGEYIPKEVGHTGEGKHHLAISILLYNNQGQVLLQKRKHLVFNDIWDFTGSTHQLHKEDSSDETDEEAALRCLKREYNIDKVENLKNYGGVNYFAMYGEFCENEHDKILTAEYNGEVDLNSEVGYNYKWMEKQEFLKDIETNPQNYAPWAVKGTHLLKEKGYFN